MRYHRQIMAVLIFGFMIGSCTNEKDFKTPIKAQESSKATLDIKATNDNSTSNVGFSEANIQYLEYPSSGVLIGQGWNSFTRLPANGSCLVFDERIVPGHDVQISTKSISNRHQLNKSLNLSVSGSYNSGLMSASAKANYSNSLKINQNSTNILANINVWRGDKFVAPVTLSVNESTPIGNAPFYPISLDKEIALQLTSGALNYNQFLALCGDSFVGHIRNGASLHAFLESKYRSKEEKEKLAVSLSASGYGARFSGNIETAKHTFDSDESVTINMFQSGGFLKSTPISIDEFYAAVSSFTESSDPELFPVKPYEIGLYKYTSLHNFPKLNDHVGNVESMEMLVTLYWLYEDLRKEYLNAILEREKYHIFESNVVRSINESGILQYCKTEGYRISPRSEFWRRDVSKKLLISCGKEEEKEYLSAYEFSNVLDNLDRVTTVQKLLRRMIKLCGIGDIAKCIPDEAVKNSVVSVTENYNAYISEFEVASVISEGLNETPNNFEFTDSLWSGLFFRKEIDAFYDRSNIAKSFTSSPEFHNRFFENISKFAPEEIVQNSNLQTELTGILKSNDSNQPIVIFINYLTNIYENKPFLDADIFKDDIFKDESKSLMFYADAYYALQSIYEFELRASAPGWYTESERCKSLVKDDNKPKLGLSDDDYQMCIEYGVNWPSIDFGDGDGPEPVDKNEKNIPITIVESDLIKTIVGYSISKSSPQSGSKENWPYSFESELSLDEVRLDLIDSFYQYYAMLPMRLVHEQTDKGGKPVYVPPFADEKDNTNQTLVAENTQSFLREFRNRKIDNLVELSESFCEGDINDFMCKDLQYLRNVLDSNYTEPLAPKISSQTKTHSERYKCGYNVWEQRRIYCNRSWTNTYWSSQIILGEDIRL